MLPCKEQHVLLFHTDSRPHFVSFFLQFLQNFVARETLGVIFQSFHELPDLLVSVVIVSMRDVMLSFSSVDTFICPNIDSEIIIIIESLRVVRH